MIEVQDRALAMISEILSQSGAADGQSVRLSQDPQGQLRLELDTEQPGDRVLNHDDRAVLLLAPTFEMSIDGGELAVNDDGETPQLTFNAKPE